MKKYHDFPPYPQVQLAEVVRRKNPPTRELAFSLRATPRLITLALRASSSHAMASAIGATDKTIYAWTTGRLQPRLADVLALPPAAAKQILTNGLHLVDWRTFPAVEFDDALVLMSRDLSGLLLANRQKRLEDCTEQELEERAKTLREINGNSGVALREIERCLADKRRDAQAQTHTSEGR